MTVTRECDGGEMDMKTQRMGRKGVSPVIATILLIAVTVILAGVLASFTFTQTGKLESKPIVSLIVEDQPNTSNYLALKHAGGDALSWADLRISVIPVTEHENVRNFVDPTDNANVQTVMSPQGGDFVAGDLVIISGTSDNVNNDLIVGHSYYVVVKHEPSGTVLLDVTVRVTSA